MLNMFSLSMFGISLAAKKIECSIYINKIEHSILSVRTKRNPRRPGVIGVVHKLWFQNRGQLPLEFHVLDLERLESGAVIGSVEVRTYDEESIVAGVPDAGVFGGWIGCGEGLPYDCGFIDVHHNFCISV